MNLFWMLIVCAVLTACDGDPVITSELRTFKVVRVDPPKRFYVDLQDMNTGRMFRNVYISKRCARWKETKVGSEHRLLQVTYRYPNDKRSVEVRAQLLCPR